MYYKHCRCFLVLSIAEPILVGSGSWSRSRIRLELSAPAFTQYCIANSVLDWILLDAYWYTAVHTGSIYNLYPSIQQQTTTTTSGNEE